MKIGYKTRDFFNPTHTAVGIDIVNWFRLLWRNKFAVDIRFWPKSLFLTVLSLMNAPFQLYEYLVYARKIKRVKVIRPIFILGHPRSGTTYLQYVLSKDPDISFCQTFEGLAPHAFLSGGKVIRFIMKLAMPDTRPQDNVKAGASLPIEEEFAMASISQTSWVHGLYFPKNIFNVFDECVTFQRGEGVKQNWKKHFLFFAQKLTYQNPNKILLLKSPCNTARVKEILEIFPDARFIHIHRNPYDVFLSNEGLYEKILPLLGFHRVKNEFMMKYILYSYEALYKKYLLDRKDVAVNQLYELSYDRFTVDPMTELRNAYHQLNLGSFDDVESFLMNEVKQSESYQKNTYDAIQEDVQVQIDTRWKFAFEAFGYELRKRN